MSTSAERMRRLRERRAAEIERGPGSPVRDVDDLLAPAVAETLAALQLAERDGGAAALALRYAEAIDGAAAPAAALRTLGPALLKCLEALGATPAGRARLPKPKVERQGPPSQLARLRAAHAAHPATRRRNGA